MNGLFFFLFFVGLLMINGLTKFHVAKLKRLSGMNFQGLCTSCYLVALTWPHQKWSLQTKMADFLWLLWHGFLQFFRGSTHDRHIQYSKCYIALAAYFQDKCASCYFVEWNCLPRNDHFKPKWPTSCVFFYGTAPWDFFVGLLMIDMSTKFNVAQWNWLEGLNFQDVRASVYLVSERGSWP